MSIYLIILLCPCYPGDLTIMPRFLHKWILFLYKYLRPHAVSNNICFHQFLIIRHKVVLKMVVVLGLWCLIYSLLLFKKVVYIWLVIIINCFMKETTTTIQSDISGTLHELDL